jgi:hypothetical protein
MDHDAKAYKAFSTGTVIQIALKIQKLLESRCPDKTYGARPNANWKDAVPSVCRVQNFLPSHICGIALTINHYEGKETFCTKQTIT